MEENRTIALSTGIHMQFDEELLERLTLLCIKYNVLLPNFRNGPMTAAQIKERQSVLCVIASVFKLLVSGNDMEEVLRWLRRVIYDKIRNYTSEEEWLKSAPEWLIRAAVHLQLRPAEQLPQPAEKLSLSACAARALLKRVHETRMNLKDPVLELIWDGVNRRPLTKLDWLLKSGDRPNPSGVLSDMEWRIVDLVLLYSDETQHPVVTDESLKAVVQRMALVTTYELAREHRLDECASRSELARRWGRAYHQYTLKGFHTSLVLLQRRWYELRRRALSLSSGELKECKLLARVAEHCPSSPGALFSWSNLVGGGMVFTPQDVIENEIINETPEWKVDCGKDTSLTDEEIVRAIEMGSEGKVTEDAKLAASKESSEKTIDVKQEVDDKDCHVEGERVGVGGEDTQSTLAENNWGLPVKTGRISSFLMFESDDDEPSPEESPDPDISTAIGLQNVASPLPDTAKTTKMETDNLVSTVDRTVTLFDNELALEMPAPIRDDTVKPEPDTPDIKIEKVKTEQPDSINLGRVEHKVELPKSAVVPSTDHVIFKGQIDPKLLMDVRVVVERLDLHGQRRSSVSRPVSRSSMCMDVDEDEDSCGDSGDVWAPSDESGSSGEEQALRPVTLRDIDEVRRRAMRKLTAQVAPVTPAAGTTSGTTSTGTLPQENSLQENAPALPPSDIDPETGMSRVVVEVTKYCPFGLSSTRLRYGEGMYRREIDAAAAANKKRNKRRTERTDKNKKRTRKRPRNGIEEEQQDSSTETTEDPPTNAEDDMREWIRQRNVNSRFFNLGLEKATKERQRRRSNPTEQNVVHSRNTRAASVGNESAHPTHNAIVPTPLPQTHHPSTALTPSGPIPAPTVQPLSGMIRIVPAISTMNVQHQSPGPVIKTAPMLQLLLTKPSVAPSPMPAIVNAVPLNIVAMPLNSVQSGNIEVPNTIIESTAMQSHDGDNDKDQLIVTENPSATTSTVTTEASTTPVASAETSADVPSVAATPSTSSSLHPEIFGNDRTVTSSEFVKHEDGSRLKVICKERAAPFWILSGGYLLLTEEPCTAMLCRGSYYTLSPPSETRRIVFDVAHAHKPSGAAAGAAAGTGTAAGAAAGSAGGAPARLCVQGKVYRKLCSAPLRYAQVLYAVRGVTHARRAARRGRSLLVYNCAARTLAPLHHYKQFLHMYDKDATEKIVIDD